MDNDNSQLDEFKPTSSYVSFMESSYKKHSSHTTSSNKDIVVYIPDLPSNFLENDIEQMIKTRIETAQRIAICDIKYYVKLGVAVIRLMNEEDRKHLIFNVQTMVLDRKSSIDISFVSEIDLESYIVLDRHMTKIPSSNEVTRRFAQVYNTQKLYDCEPISAQFPNIFRVFINIFDDIIQTTTVSDFKIDNNLATVYPRADCSFFENLPPTINENKLSSAVAAQIDENQLSSPSFYVQYNKKAANAIVLTAKSAKKWITEGNLTVDGQTISQKAKLAYRVLVSPIPRGFNLDRILNNKLFSGHIIAHKHINNSLVLELDDMDKYKECLEIGAIRIDNQMMSVEPHTIISDSDSNEINAVNWYETAMLDMKPDIVTLIRNHQHPIFHYKWNADNWIQQMQKVKNMDRRSKSYDLHRHLLRVTVMLNTIAVLRKKQYVVDGETVILKSERMRTITYDHKSKLFYGKKISETEFKTPYPSTNVKVVNEDCLVLYEKLVSEGNQPLLLNMANANSPGGGYRKGDAAQEENIFRRSDYYQSLDIDLADTDRSERLYCTSKCEIKQQTSYTRLYPIDEFGAIYTSGITVFRELENNGYALKKNPLYNVCAIAMAAYREPLLTNRNMLENKFAINTYRKIENIFAIAHHHKHDCLVLSAFGCGAFRNPPAHIASLFKSVIYQYAGYFKTIYFAIVDDHNAGGQMNPHGNFQPFEQTLDGLIVKPTKTHRVNGVSGPYRILNKSLDGQITLSDAFISYHLPCQYGTKCRDLKDSEHTKTYSHPPVCSQHGTTSACDQMDDEVHMFTFFHTIRCKYGGECTNTDPTHLSEYTHPEFCKNGGNCQSINPEHLSAYRHLPICQDGITCYKYLRGTADHCNSFRHCKSICPYDNCCANFHDKEHIQNTIHSFRQPCPFTPYNCSIFVDYIQAPKGSQIPEEIETHCLTFSHICPHGRQCHTKDDGHYETFIHIARNFCPDLDKCLKLTDEDHLESFSHPTIRDIRLFCRELGYKCPERFKDEHLKEYRHGENRNHLSVAPSSSLNSFINFFQNQNELISNINNYVDASKWKKATISQEILNWMRALQPVHRCGKLIFESILVHGHVMSRHYMNLLKKPKYVVQAVQQHSQVRLIFLQHNIPEVKQNISELIKILVEAEFTKARTDGATSLDPDHDNNIHMVERKLKPPLTDQDIKIIHNWAVKIAQASIKLNNAPMGIGYDVDQKLGTDKHIFSILGPHRGYYYGDIIIVFKQEIMFHPDANFSIQAGTSFYSGRTYTHRPWIKDPGSEDKRIQHFHSSKLHCSVPHYEYAAATELIAITGRNKQSMDISLHEILQRWATVDSHEVFEGHLPQLITLDYIDSVYMPKNLFESLTPEAQHSARAVFGDSLIITKHVIDLSLLKPGVTVPLDATRIPYQDFVLEKIDRKIDQKIKAAHLSPGIVITVPGSKFEEHIALPMTVSQSYHLYRFNKPQAPSIPEFTYIYWQAMNGDMMLTLSNEKIDASKDQPNLRCIVCYIAEKPSTATEDYHEAYSYLNDGQPFQHYIYVHEGRFRAKSNVFYRGCNTDDFFTFCLKLSHKTGDIILSHAGPNGIYNHEKIHYQFNKSDLDLSRIDYIHVGGGIHDVPIRNLIINHERIPELHPLIDKDFKIDTSGLLRKRRGAVDHIVPAPKPRRQRSISVEAPRTTEKLSFFDKLKNSLFGSSAETTTSMPTSHSSTSASPKHDSPTTSRTTLDSLKTNPSTSNFPPKLTPCRDSVYCLNQNSKEHTEKYSHPCRFNELCRKQNDEPHLVHERHNVPKCSKDRECPELTDPVHRAKYRHRGLPDYLIPCRHQNTCYDKNPEHRLKFFHGEELPLIKKNKS